MFQDTIRKHQAALRTAAALNIPLDLHRKDVANLDTLLEGHIETVTKALEKLTKGEKTTEEKLIELRGEITELSQKMAQGGRGGGSRAPEENCGSLFVRQKSEELAALNAGDGNARRVSLAMKAVTGGASSGGALAQPDRDDVVMMPRRTVMVRDLLPVIKITTGSVEYPKQTTRTNAAAAVAEGDLKPESSTAWTLATAPVRTIAHWLPASRQILDDAPQLAGIINEELLYGLADVEDLQILMGDGTGQNLPGLYTNAVAYSAPYVLTAANKMDRIGSALLQLALADYAGDGIVMHPSDWLRIKLLKDSAGGYLTQDPLLGSVKGGATAATALPMLWGVPVIPTKAIPVGKFLVGQFRTAATLYDRWEARVEVSSEDRDNFIRNMVTILAEERLALALKQAGALIKGDFSADA